MRNSLDTFGSKQFSRLNKLPDFGSLKTEACLENAVKLYVDLQFCQVSL